LFPAAAAAAAAANRRHPPCTVTRSRISIADALRHPYFVNTGLDPTPCIGMPMDPITVPLDESGDTKYKVGQLKAIVQDSVKKYTHQESSSCCVVS
jgi:hypothetical protein